VHPDCPECCPPHIECNQHAQCPDGYACCFGTRTCYHPAVSDCPDITPRCDDGGGCPGDLTCSPQYDVCVPPGPHPGFAWHFTCGYPVCGNPNLPDVADDPDTPNCTTEHVGDACDVPGALCDGVGSCGRMLSCSDHDPEQCPISRVRYKRDIEYVDDAQRRKLAQALLSTPLPARAERVGVYGQLSRAVAAIQVQHEQLRALQDELERVRARLAPQSAPQCGP